MDVATEVGIDELMGAEDQQHQQQPQESFSEDNQQQYVEDVVPATEEGTVGTEEVAPSTELGTVDDVVASVVEHAIEQNTTTNGQTISSPKIVVTADQYEVVVSKNAPIVENEESEDSEEEDDDKVVSELAPSESVVAAPAPEPQGEDVNDGIPRIAPKKKVAKGTQAEGKKSTRTASAKAVEAEGEAEEEGEEESAHYRVRTGVGRKTVLISLPPVLVGSKRKRTPTEKVRKSEESSKRRESERKSREKEKEKAKKRTASSSPLKKRARRSSSKEAEPKKRSSSKKGASAKRSPSKKGVPAKKSSSKKGVPAKKSSSTKAKPGSKVVRSKKDSMSRTSKDKKQKDRATSTSRISGKKKTATSRMSKSRNKVSVQIVPKKKSLAKKTKLSAMDARIKYRARLSTLDPKDFAVLDGKWISVYEPSLRKTSPKEGNFPKWTAILNEEAQDKGVHIKGVLPHYSRTIEGTDLKVYEVKPEIVDWDKEEEYKEAGYNKVLPERVYVGKAFKTMGLEESPFAFTVQDTKNDVFWEDVKKILEAPSESEESVSEEEETESE